MSAFVFHVMLATSVLEELTKLFVPLATGLHQELHHAPNAKQDLSARRLFKQHA